MKIAAWSDGHGILPKIKEYADVLIIAGNILSIKEASYHRFKDITYIHNKNIPMSLREKYTLLKNSLNVKIVEMG